MEGIEFLDHSTTPSPIDAYLPISRRFVLYWRFRRAVGGRSGHYAPMPRRDRRAPTIDPEQQRYQRKYPRFPGVAEVVRLLKLGGTRGSYLDAVLWDLREHAPEVLDDVTNAVTEEVDERIRTLLVAELAETGDPRLVVFFADLLEDANESVAYWAEVGLQHIGTKEARTVLFQHRGPEHARRRRRRRRHLRRPQ